jgi:hypothetical protein
MVIFVKNRETLGGYNTAFIFDENERVKRDYHEILTPCFLIYNYPQSLVIRLSPFFAGSFISFFV